MAAGLQDGLDGLDIPPVIGNMLDDFG